MASLCHGLAAFLWSSLNGRGSLAEQQKKELLIAKPNKATQTKRNRERARTEKQQVKEEKRGLRNEMKKDRERLVAEGIDPDLDGIVPGPQPIPSW